MSKVEVLDADVAFTSVGQAAQKVVEQTGRALAAKPDQTALKAWEGQAENDAFLSMVERAARDPNVDIDKMKSLMAMRREEMALRAERSFEDAMAAAQAEMEPVRKDANNPQTKSKYASYFALDTAIRPIYTKHGFSLSFDTADGAPEGSVRIVCKVACQGHRERPHIDMPADGKGARGGDVMTKTHATGSAVTYGRRNLLGMIFNIAVEKDDDGNAAGRATEPEKINPKQLERLEKLLEETDSDKAAFCGIGNLDALPDMLAADFADAIRLLEQKKAKMGRAA